MAILFLKAAASKELCRGLPLLRTQSEVLDRSDLALLNLGRERRELLETMARKSLLGKGQQKLVKMDV